MLTINATRKNRRQAPDNHCDEERLFASNAGEPTTGFGAQVIAGRRRNQPLRMGTGLAPVA